MKLRIEITTNNAAFGPTASDRGQHSDAMRAYVIASDYGSFLHNADRGACFYAFRFNDGRPDSEQHRAKCIAYTRHLIAHASRKGSGWQRHQARMADILDLRWLLAWFHRCELYPRKENANYSRGRVDIAM